MDRSYEVVQNGPVARKTTFAGKAPRRIVAVIAFDGVVLGDLATPCEVFALARDRAGRPAYEVRVCSALRNVRSEHVALDVPWRLSSLARAHTIVVPGVHDLGLRAGQDVLRAIRRAVDRGARVASVCTGAFVLAAAGVLDGKRATTHWKAAPELARRHPQVTVDPDVLYVDNGRVLTSAGAAAAFDLCLHLVRCDLGADAAAATARGTVMPLERAGGQAQFIVHPPPASEAGSFESLLEWADKNVKGDLLLAALARRAGMSKRTLTRRFREQVGTTPAQWVAHARVRRAQRLLETTDLSIERLASEVGFGSSAVLRERFHELLGTSPQNYRRAFAARAT
jgi:transcriptional regulator GlxA family with amidase domain